MTTWVRRAFVNIPRGSSPSSFPCPWQQESEMSTTPQWRLAFVLPNLRLGEHHKSPSELTLGLDGIAIVPASDPRVVEIREWYDPAERFLTSFHDGNSTAITPAALIVREDWQSGIVANPEPRLVRRLVVRELRRPSRPASARWLEVRLPDTRAQFDWVPARRPPAHARSAGSTTAPDAYRRELGGSPPARVVASLWTEAR